MYLKYTSGTGLNTEQAPPNHAQSSWPPACLAGWADTLAGWAGWLAGWVAWAGWAVKAQPAQAAQPGNQAAQTDKLSSQPGKSKMSHL